MKGYRLMSLLRPGSWDYVSHCNQPSQGQSTVYCLVLQDVLV